ncbi:DUF1048 domain-containing protein [Cytobacillus sp. FSL W7-1323]|uniref:DUF1048 domain-containing protein n=1 Tax=Cytobacillus TaxID=2675230 RepID=UPI0027833169|nr:DUF1048 domain-containing protein [Cytobacillus kochii]MDQ0183829.1 DNA-binding ferritin-like protein (Dps family) [Cytobacillus kochii]
MKNLFEKLIGSKKRYNDYKAEKEQLPQSYKDALHALEQYMWNFAKGENFMEVLENMLQLFKESSIEQLPLQDIMGNDPVEFANAIMAQYPEELWFIKSQEKLRLEIERLNNN